MTKHKVHQGERLSTIAAHYGISHEHFLAANPGRETTVLPSGETVFRSLSTGDELEVPWMVHHVQPAPTEEPRALGAVAPMRSPQGATTSLQRLRRPPPQSAPPPKIGAHGLTDAQKTYEERKHLLMLIEKSIAKINTGLGPRANPDSLKAARLEWYQNIQRAVHELGVYATFNATHVPNITKVRAAIQALGQQVDVFGTLVSYGGTEAQVADAFSAMSEAAKALMQTLLF